MAEAMERLSLMVVSDGRIHVGMELDHVMELIRDVSVTPLPCVPEYYEGICNWKGKLVPVVSLQRAGELPAAEGPGSGVVIIVRSGDLECGFLIGNEPGIVYVNPEDRIEGEVPEKLGGLLAVGKVYTEGQRIIPVLDIPETLEHLVVYR